MPIMEKVNRWPKDRIKALRKAYGKTQQEFCGLLGVATVTLCLWEQGRGVPNGSALILLDRLEGELNAQQSLQRASAPASV